MADSHLPLSALLSHCCCLTRLGQSVERLKVGSIWVETSHVFTTDEGTAAAPTPRSR
jgi:hypothetical protein